jgi:hypothetical protein
LREHHFLLGRYWDHFVVSAMRDDFPRVRARYGPFFEPRG